jgi:hypothetical protein
MKYVVGFGHFWYDFIVGDSIVLAIGGVAVLAMSALLLHLHATSLAEVALPAGVIATLTVSLYVDDSA